MRNGAAPARAVVSEEVTARSAAQLERRPSGCGGRSLQPHTHDAAFGRGLSPDGRRPAVIRLFDQAEGRFVRAEEESVARAAREELDARVGLAGVGFEAQRKAAVLLEPP